MTSIPLLAEMDAAAVGIAFWVCIMLICVVPSVAYYWQKTREAELNAALKQEMVARGYSADEILAVVNNKPLKGEKSTRLPVKPQVEQPYV